MLDLSILLVYNTRVMNSISKEKGCENKFVLAFQNLIYSNLFPLLISLLTLVFYFVNGFIGILIFSITATFIFIFCKDMSGVLPLFFNAPFLLSDLKIFDNPLNFLVFLPALIGVIFHFIKHPSKVKLGVYGISLLCVLLSYFLSGILYENHYFFFQPDKAWFGLTMSLVLGVGLGSIVTYLVLKIGLHSERIKNFDLSVYIANTLIYLALMVTMQVIFTRATGNMTAWFGWGHRNFTGIIILLSVPMCAYLLIKTERIFTYLFIILFLTLGTVISEVDAATGIILIFSPLMAFYILSKLKKRKKMIFLNACYTFVLLFLALVFYKLASDPTYLHSLYNRFIDDSGRTYIYQNAIKLFKENPIFGKGVFYPFIHMYWWTTNYHSSIIQALATTGVFGLTMLLFTYFARFNILMKKDTPFNGCALLTVIFFIAHSSIDCGESTVISLIVVALITATEHLNKFDKQTLPLLSLS